MKTKAAIIGSGNIGTDLMIKIMRHSDVLEMGAMVGIDPASDGLARAGRLGVATTHEGLEGLMSLPVWPEIGIVFDATSASAHRRHSEAVTVAGKRMVDLTPAAIGPYVIPVVNGDAHLDAPNVNMVTCGGQATIPIVAAVSSVATVHYAEIVASIASKSAGPGTRANIDEFTETTSRGIEQVGGAAKGKAIIILNPAEPPMLMRDTVFTLSSGAEEATIEAAVEAMAKEIADRSKALDVCENSFKQLTERYENRRANVEQNARYLTGMPPADAVKILAASDDQTVIDVLRAVEELAAKSGEASVVSYWLSLLPPDRSAAIQRKMNVKPASLE